MPTAASPWKDNLPPHLPCRRGQLPAAVLFPGDPARVDRFSDILKDFRILGQNREFRIGTGTFRGVPLGVCSTGIGGPSTEIALVEAAELGCRFALRVGGTGALDPAIPPGSLLIVTEAQRGGGAAAHYALPSHPAKAHPHMLAALTQAAGPQAIQATVASTDSYYAAQGRTYINAPKTVAFILHQYRQAGAVALDMETETVLILGEALGLIAGSLLAVHGNRATDEWMEDFTPVQDRMIHIACQALTTLAKS